MVLDATSTLIKSKVKELSIQKKLDGRRILVFGCNRYTERINNFLYEEGYFLSGIIDNDKEKHGKQIGNVEIMEPGSIEWDRGQQSYAVLIASKHRKSMIRQIRHLSKNASIFVLADVDKDLEGVEKKTKFWLEENYEAEVEKIYQGAAIYDKLIRTGTLVVFPLRSLGDMFFGGLYFREYKNKLKSADIKIVTVSKGTYEVAQLFKMSGVEVISEEEMDALVKYMLFNGIENGNVICSYGILFWNMATYKKDPFVRYNAKYFFGLDDYCQTVFPSIWDKGLTEEEITKKGFVKGKTVIFAPYATSIAELPYQFWDILAEKMMDMGFRVVTNIVGGQKPVKGSMGVEIPLHQIGTYLEFAGYFVSIRSGLCDVAGHSRCKQIIIYRKQNSSFYDSDINFYNLHIDGISENAVQLVYNDYALLENIDIVMKFLLDES